MKDEQNTEMPGAPLVPDAKKVATPKVVAHATSKNSPTQKPQSSSTSDPAESADNAIEDSIARQSSDFLSEEERAEANPMNAPSSKGKIRRFFHAWWHNKKARWTTIILVLLLIIGAAVWPTSRYFLLNTAGVRSSASVVVLDNNTRQPLKNVAVNLNNASGTTNDDGYVKLEKVRLGKTELVVERKAFAPLAKPVTVGWGSNPLGDVILQPKGLQYSFIVKDFLSGKPIEKAEAVSGDASAFSDKEGKLVLTLDTTSDEPVEIQIKADGYRTDSITETADGATEQEVNMVPAQPQAFISKRSGKYDLYKIYADGQGEELVLSGTGFERDDIVLVPQPTGDNVALVSTRDGARSADGNLMSTLNVVNLGDKKATKLDSGDRVRVVGWIENTLVYIVVTDQAPAGGAKKQRLVTYNLETNQKLDITSATYFNDVIVAGDKIYYAPATESSQGEGSSNVQPGFYVSNTSGTDTKRLLDQEVWSMIRTGYDTITLTSGKDWYDYKLGDTKVTKINGPPASQKTRVYTNNSNNTHSLWVDERDGKGVLLNYNLGNKEEKILVGQSGLVYPVRWLNNTTAVYRVNNDSETADYVVSINGGNPRKITDVTNTGGIDRWYYY